MSNEQTLNQERVVCPVCGQDDRVFKVSRIYIDALAAFGKSYEDFVMPELTGKSVEDPGINLLKVQAVRAFVKNFSPPSGNKQNMRQVHPDLIVAIFSLIAIFFMVQIYRTQPSTFALALAILAVFYVGYFMLHKRIVGRFERQKTEERVDQQRLERGVALWMKLYFCARDEGVFDPAQNRLIPLDQMDLYLLQEEE